jgi:hypothetical protein
LSRFAALHASSSARWPYRLDRVTARRVVVTQVDVQVQVGRRQQAAGLLRPFGQLQAGAGEDVAKARVFPFARIVEAVEVEVPGHFGIRASASS